METNAIILAAGQGTRMKSQMPKVLHPLLGQPLVRYSVDLAVSVTGQRPWVVVGHGAEQVAKTLGEGVGLVIQELQLGTGHAVLQTEPVIGNSVEQVLVLSADMPLLRRETIAALIEAQAANSGPLSLLTVSGPDSHGFGRILRGPDGAVIAIVEEAQATPEQLAIREYNVGAYCIRTDFLWQALRSVPLSPKGEYYLTDIIHTAASQGLPVRASAVAEPEEALGINNRVHLAEAERCMRRRINQEWMLKGVTLLDPERVYIEPGVSLQADTVIWPETYLKGNTRVGEGCVLGPGTIIENSSIGQGCRILSSVIESAVVEDHVEIGPYCHLRKGAHLGSGVHMGNFGEVKDSTLGAGTKMGHFSYIGNATIGENVNIGAGTITCNYDGKSKNQTVIEDDVFIGSDTMLVAPVRISKAAKTGAGAVVNRDVPPGEVVVGVPARPIKKSGA